MYLVFHISSESFRQYSADLQRSLKISEDEPNTIGNPWNYKASYEIRPSLNYLKDDHRKSSNLFVALVRTKFGNRHCNFPMYYNFALLLHFSVLVQKHCTELHCFD